MYFVHRKKDMNLGEQREDCSRLNDVPPTFMPTSQNSCSHERINSVVLGHLVWGHFLWHPYKTKMLSFIFLIALSTVFLCFWCSAASL